MANMTTSIMGMLRARNPALCERMLNGGASFDLCQEHAKISARSRAITCHSSHMNSSRRPGRCYRNSIKTGRRQKRLAALDTSGGTYENPIVLADAPPSKSFAHLGFMKFRSDTYDIHISLLFGSSRFFMAFGSILRVRRCIAAILVRSHHDVRCGPCGSS